MDTAYGSTLQLTTDHGASVDRDKSLHRAVIGIVITRSPADQTADAGIFSVRSAHVNRGIEQMTILKRNHRHRVNTFNECAAALIGITHHLGIKDRYIVDHNTGITRKTTGEERFRKPLQV